MKIGRKINFILSLKTLPFKRFSSKGTNHSNARQILLYDGREFTLLHIHIFKGLCNFGMKKNRVEDNDRNKDSRNKGQFSIYLQHKEDTKCNQYRNANQIHQLFRQKGFHRIHIRGAALNDISRRMFLMPCIRKANDMGIQFISKRFNKTLCSFCNIDPVENPCKSCQRCQYNHKDGNADQMFFQKVDTPEVTQESGKEHRKLRFLRSDYTIHSKSDNSGIEQIQDGSQDHKQERQKIVFF